MRAHNLINSKAKLVLFRRIAVFHYIFKTSSIDFEVSAKSRSEKRYEINGGITWSSYQALFQSDLYKHTALGCSRVDIASYDLTAVAFNSNAGG